MEDNIELLLKLKVNIANIDKDLLRLVKGVDSKSAIIHCIENGIECSILALKPLYAVAETTENEMQILEEYAIELDENNEHIYILSNHLMSAVLRVNIYTFTTGELNVILTQMYHLAILLGINFDKLY